MKSLITIFRILLIFSLFSITCEQVLSNIDTVRPQNSNYWTGSCNSSAKTMTSKMMCWNTEDGWVKFSIGTAIPVGSIIDSVVFVGYVDSTYYPYWAVTPVSVDPVTAAASTLNADITAEEYSGYYIYREESSSYAPGWKQHNLGATAASNFQSSISQGWFAIGLASTDNDPTYGLRWHGWNEINKPFLIVYYSPPTPMTYVSSTVTQDTYDVWAGATNQKVIGIEIVTGGGFNPALIATGFTLNTTGTTSTLDISNAKLWYTGTSSSFTTGNQFGTTIATPTVSFTITGADTLALGTNYFWLTYDVSSTATINNYIDAQCTQITIGTSNYIPTVTSPTGARKIVPAGTFNLPWFEGFETVGPVTTFTSNQALINGTLYWAYEKTTTGRFRSNAGPGFYKTGNAAATLDCSSDGTDAQNDIIATLPLANYNGAQDIELSFYVMDHGDETSTQDGVYIRGSSTDQWIQAFVLTPGSYTNGSWNYFSGIDIDALLAANSQVFTNTFQLKFTQFDNYMATSTTSTDGMTFDDILLTGNLPVARNAGIAGLPALPPCSGVTMVTATLFNYGTDTLISCNINWSVNGVPQGSTMNWTGSLSTGTSIVVALGSYNFVAGVFYEVKAWTSLPNGQIDQASGNDTIVVSFTIPVPYSIPYTENFSTWPPAGWELTGGTQSWAQYSNYAAYCNFWGWTVPNNAVMTTPLINLSGASNPYLRFKWSHQYNSSYPGDTLKISIRECNGPETYIWVKGGTDLNSNDGAGSTTPGSFVTAYVNIPSAFYNKQVMIRFNGVSGYGPDCYVDEVTVFDSISGTVSLGPDASICPGSSITLDAGAGFYAYLWSDNSTSQTLVVTTAGTYSVTVYSSSGPIGSDTIIISMYPATPANAGSDQTICAGACTNLTATGGVSYAWAHGPVTSTVSVCPTITTNYIVTVTDLNGCTGSDEVTVLVNPLPLANAGSDVSICSGICANLTATGGVSYQWSNSSMSSSITVCPTTTTTYVVTVTDVNACSATDDVVVTVTSGVNVYLGSDDTICAGTTLTLQPVMTDLIFSEYIEGSSYNKALEIYNGTGITVDLADYRIAQSTNGGGWQYYHYFPAGAMLSSGDVWVMVHNQIDISLYDTIYADEVIAGASVVNHNGNDARAIQRTFDGGQTWVMIDVIGVPSPDPGNGWNVAGVTEATMNHTLVRKSTVCMPNTDWASSAGTTAANSEWVVYPQNTFTYLGYHTSTCAPSYVYNWNTGAVTSSITVTPTSGSTYSVTVTDINGCTGSDAIVLMTHTSPVANAGTDKLICPGGCDTLVASGGVFYKWSNGDTTDHAIVCPVVTTMYSVTVTNIQGCTDDDDVWVNVKPDIFVDLGSDVSICGWDFLFLNAGAGYTSYLWSNGSTSSVIIVHFTDTMPYGPYTYYVDVWDDLGCKGSDTVIITYVECIGITENADNMQIGIFPNPSKGIFHITIGNITGDLDMTIFNIQGQLIHSEKLEGVIHDFSRQFDLSVHPKGVYYIKLMNKDLIGVKKVILQ